MSLRLLCAAAAATSIVACAAAVPQSSKAAAPIAAPATQQLPQPSTSQDDQIATLSREIDEQRVALNLPAPTPAAHAVMPMTQDAHSTIAPTAPTGPTCHPASDTCTQSCTLSETICDNAKNICDIASELPGDAWASNKCVEGNETCAAAKKHCCDCAP